ncbi:hypothetical protein HK104_007467, partial [Borealophlyctis nickersoniae]
MSVKSTDRLLRPISRDTMSSGWRDSDALMSIDGRRSVSPTSFAHHADDVGRGGHVLWKGVAGTSNAGSQTSDAKPLPVLKALVAFHPTTATQIRISPGDMLTIHHLESAGWCYGVNTSLAGNPEGYFPAICVFNAETVTRAGGAQSTGRRSIDASKTQSGPSRTMELLEEFLSLARSTTSKSKRNSGQASSARSMSPVNAHFKDVVVHGHHQMPPTWVMTEMPEGTEVELDPKLEAAAGDWLRPAGMSMEGFPVGAAAPVGAPVGSRRGRGRGAPNRKDSNTRVRLESVPAQQPWYKRRKPLILCVFATVLLIVAGVVVTLVLV